LPKFLTRPFPSITNMAGVSARNRLRDSFMDVYGPGHDQTDPTVSAICRQRAAVLRRHNWPVADIAGSETMLAAAATLNTVPTLFWSLYYLLPHADVVAGLRAELEPRLVRGGGGDGPTVDVVVGVLDRECPLLLSCYREALRMASQAVSMRRVMEDTVISDGHGGSYLLKKGTDLQIAGAVLRSMEDIWGPDAGEYNPQRFTPETEKRCSNEEAKMRKAAYFPFGGGKHLCPGRNFAYAEILATICMVVVGFDVKPLKGDRFATLGASPPRFSSAVVKPVGNGAGYGIKIARRKGWENVRWCFRNN
jgi:cytochrome P450